MIMLYDHFSCLHLKVLHFYPYKPVIVKCNKYSICQNTILLKKKNPYPLIVDMYSMKHTYTFCDQEKKIHHL